PQADGHEWFPVSGRIRIAESEPGHPASDLPDPVAAGPLQVGLQAGSAPGWGQGRPRARWVGRHRFFEEIPDPRWLEVEEREEVEHHAPEVPKGLFPAWREQ